MVKKKKIFDDRTDMFFHTERATKKKLEEIADEERESLSMVINQALIEFINRKKAVGPENPLNIKYANETNKDSVFNEFPIDRYFTVEDARSKVQDYINKYKVSLPHAFAYHNNMQQVIAFKMKVQFKQQVIKP